MIDLTKDPKTLARKAPDNGYVVTTKSAVGPSNDVIELGHAIAERIESDPGADPLQKFSGDMSLDEIMAQLRALQPTAREQQKR